MIEQKLDFVVVTKLLLKQQCLFDLPDPGVRRTNLLFVRRGPSSNSLLRAPIAFRWPARLARNWNIRRGLPKVIGLPASLDLTLKFPGTTSFR